MTNRTRPLFAVLVACATWLGCEDSPPPVTPDAGQQPDASQQAPEDAGSDAGTLSDGGSDAGTLSDGGSEAWDGTAVPLEELGDSADPGHPYAQCGTFLADDAGTPISCGSLASFDLSACNRDTLGSLSPAGKYGLMVRTAAAAMLPHSIVLTADGQKESAPGVFYPVIDKQVDGNTFFVTGQRNYPDGGTTIYSYAGCQAESARDFTGCYQSCVNGGARRTQGTFTGTRLQRVTEPESKNLALISESRIENLGLIVDVYVHKNHAYVVSLSVGRDAPMVGGLTVFDLTDKAHPVYRKTLTMEGDTGWNAVWAKGDALYVGSAKHGVLVYDITQPGDPQFIRGVPGDSISVHTLYIDGDRMYAQAAGVNQVLFFDVSAPLQPVLLNRYTVPADDRYGYPHDAFAYQNRLYINQMGQGYYVVDVTDVASPKMLGSYIYDAHNNWTHANAVGTFAGRTIAFEGSEWDNAHLRVLDVTDPAKIVKIGEVKMRPQTSIHNMVLVGTRLYVAWYAEGLRVFDVANPTKPKEVAYFNTFRDAEPGHDPYSIVSATGIRVPGDGYIYVADSARGLLIFREQ
ncbi:hypothetical protein P2318_28675 [Myxococcaceae bacterium GXIMD 01537]